MGLRAFNVSIYPKHIKYQPHIDGLRALSVLAVVLFHALPEYDWGGFVGVDIFFVISGYLISKILLNDLSLQKFSILQFYIRRIRRIFPSLILVLLFCLLIGSGILMPDEYQSLAKEMMAGIAFVSNLLFMQQVGYFDLAAETKPLLHLWSLGVEEQFYIFWPLILLGLYRLGFKYAEKLIIALMIISLAISTYYTNHNSEIAFYSPFTRFWELLLGALLANRQARDGQLSIVLKEKTSLANAESVLGIVLILSAFIFINETRSFPGVWAVLPTVGAWLIIKSGSASWFNRHVLANKYMVLIGLISYPLYLWHWPLLSFAHIIEGQTPSLLWRILAVISSFILAWASYRFVEKNVRAHENAKLMAGFLVIVMTIMGFLAYKIYEQKGHKFRLITTAEYTEAFMSTKQWLATQKRDCQARYPGEGLCFTNTPHGQNEHVIFLGDSHADVVSAGVLKNYPEIYATSFMAFGCPPFLGVNRIVKKQLNNCGAYTRHVLDKFKSIPNQTVILSARFAMYETGKGFKLPNQNLEEPDAHIQSSEFKGFDAHANYHQVFTAGLRNTLNFLEQQHKSTVFVYQVPELGFDPRGCVSRPLREAVAGQCRIPRRVVDARQASYRKAVESVFKDYPNVVTFDPVSVLCDANYCYGGNGRDIFYKDDDHLSITGSKLIAPGLRNAILQAQEK